MPEDMTVPTASVIIRCLNEMAHLPTLFERLAEQQFRDFEVIVVDSGSTDGTLEFLEGQDITLVTIDPSEFSFGRSLNFGCRAARGTYLVSISAHCYPMDSQWLGNLLTGFHADDIAYVYGKQRGHESSHFSELQVFKRWFPEASEMRQTTNFCNNANSAVRRDLWEKHEFDESLPGLEDLELAERLHRQGYHVAYLADAGVTHVHNETRKQTFNRYLREAIAMQHIHPNEHFHLGDFVRLFSANARNDIKAARAEKRLIRELWGILAFRRAQFWGAYKGFRTRWPVTSELKKRFYYPDRADD